MAFDWNYIHFHSRLNSANNRLEWSSSTASTSVAEW